MLLRFPLLESIRSIRFIFQGGGYIFHRNFLYIYYPSRGIKNPRVSLGVKMPAKVHVTVRVKARMQRQKSFLVYQGDDCEKKRERASPRLATPLCVPAWATNEFKQ